MIIGYVLLNLSPPKSAPRLPDAKEAATVDLVSSLLSCYGFTFRVYALLRRKAFLVLEHMV